MRTVVLLVAFALEDVANAIDGTPMPVTVVMFLAGIFLIVAAFDVLEFLK